MVVEVETGKTTPITGGADALFGAPAWLPDGRTIAALGGRVPENVYRNDIWLFAAAAATPAATAGAASSGQQGACCPAWG